LHDIISKNKNKMYYILTMGCQLNENDSEKLIGIMEEMGYSKSEDIKNADLYVINTCCVRENAEEKLFGKLGELKKIKENKNIIIAIGGAAMKRIIPKTRGGAIDRPISFGNTIEGLSF
jgi:tRNA-2-methylthio-N6-dimethylallyladenosine synthase